jgi:hypothetical protein
MVVQFPLTSAQRWQLYSKLQAVNLLLVIMFIWSGYVEHSPLRFLLAVGYAALWVAGVRIPSENMSFFFGLNVVMLLVCIFLGPAL